MNVLDTLRMYQELKDFMAPEAAEKIVQIMGHVYDELRENVTKADFRELKDIISRLGEAQERTEKQIGSLSERMDQLTVRMDRLTERMDQLTVRMDTLTERVDQLARAQIRTEKEIAALTAEMKAVNKRVGGLSMTIGYGLEDKIMPYIPDFAKSTYGMTVEIVDRRNIEYSETDYDEINIYAEGRINEEIHHIIGECKAHPSKKDADRFAAMIERLHAELPGEILPLLIGYSYQPSVEKYIRSKYPGIELMKSYEFELRYRKTQIQGPV